MALCQDTSLSTWALCGRTNTPVFAPFCCYHSTRCRWLLGDGRPVQSSGPGSSRSSPTVWMWAAPRIGLYLGPPLPVSPCAARSRAWCLLSPRPALPQGSRRWKSPALCSHAPERPGGPMFAEDAGWCWPRYPTYGLQTGPARRPLRFAKPTCGRTWPISLVCLHSIQKCKRGCQRSRCCPKYSPACSFWRARPGSRSGAPPPGVGPTPPDPRCPRSPVCSRLGTMPCRSPQVAAGAGAGRPAKLRKAAPTRPAWQQWMDVRPGFGEPALVLLFDALDFLRYPCARIGRDSVGNGHVNPLVLLWGPDRPGKETDLGHRASRRSVRSCCAGNTPSNPDYILLLQAAVDIDVVDEWWETGKRGQVCAPSVAPKVWGVRDLRNQIALEGILLQDVERNGLFGA